MALNVKKAGFDPRTRFHDLRATMEFLEQWGTPPDIIFYGETTYLHLFDNAPECALLNLLDDYRAHTDTPGVYRYYPSRVPGSKNRPGLFLATDKIRVTEYYDPGLDVGEARENFVVANINGNKVYLKSIHWNAARGDTSLMEQSTLLADLVRFPTLVGGDFNLTSSGLSEVVPKDLENISFQLGMPHRPRQMGTLGLDRKTMVPHNAPLDRLLHEGWRDAGIVDGTYNVTVTDGELAVRKDRIMWSPHLNVELVPGSYRLISGRSDHLAVCCELIFHPPAPSPRPRAT